MFALIKIIGIIATGRALFCNAVERSICAVSRSLLRWDDKAGLSWRRTRQLFVVLEERSICAVSRSLLRWDDKDSFVMPGNEATVCRAGGTKHPFVMLSNEASARLTDPSFVGMTKTG